MATTEQVRRWYPEVVANHASRGTAGYRPTCDTQKAVRVPFPREGSETPWQLLVHPATVEAWAAYTQTMRHHGETVPPAGGTHSCRNIGTSVWPSLHAYCVALDIPPNGRKTASFVAAVAGIRTRGGVRVFRGIAGDRMHDQIDCSPDDLTSGIDWATVPGGDTMAADHTHIPPSSDLPRGWADRAWDVWVARSGTAPDTRTHDLYREDLAWVYERVIAPLEAEVAELRALISGAGAGGDHGHPAITEELEAVKGHLRLAGA